MRKLLVYCSFLVFPLVTLWACAHETAEETKTEVVKLLDNVTTSWDGESLPNYPTAQPAVTLLKITVPPHSILANHYHSVINVGYMLEGELTVTDIDGNAKTIKAGESLIELVGKVHYGENTTDKNAVILVFYAGDVDSEITTEVE